MFSALKSTRVHGAHCLVDERNSCHGAGAMYRMLGFSAAEGSVLTTDQDNNRVFVANI